MRSGSFVRDFETPAAVLSAIQNCATLLRQGRPAPHREARQKRRDQRLKQQAEQEELELRMRELQTANEAKQLELETTRKVRRKETLGNLLPFLRLIHSLTFVTCSTWLLVIIL